MSAGEVRALISGVYDALKRGDVAFLQTAFAAEYVLYEPSFLPFGGTYRGFDGLQAVAQQLGAAVDFSRLEVLRLIADDDGAASVITIPERDGGEVLQLGEYFTVRDGVIVDVWVSYHHAGSFIATSGSGNAV